MTPAETEPAGDDAGARLGVTLQAVAKDARVRAVYLGEERHG